MPLVLGTGSYPIAIVDGNSMYPTLLNGDLIVYKKAEFDSVGPGTIIIFNQGGTGFPMLDTLLKPVLIHRVQDILVDPDGTVSYKTKGDNNQASDPVLVKYSEILGTPQIVVPHGGIIALFLRSPSGGAAAAGVIVLIYALKFRRRAEAKARKEKFMTLLARMVLNGDMTMGLFDKLKLAIEYAGNISELEIKDSRIVALVDWIKNGGLDSDWYIEASDCPTCKTRSICIRGFGDSQYVLCPSMSCGVERTGSAAQ